MSPATTVTIREVTIMGAAPNTPAPGAQVGLKKNSVSFPSPVVKRRTPLAIKKSRIVTTSAPITSRARLVSQRPRRSCWRSFEAPVK